MVRRGDLFSVREHKRSLGSGSVGRPVWGGGERRWGGLRDVVGVRFKQRRGPSPSLFEPHDSLSHGISRWQFPTPPPPGFGFASISGVMPAPRPCCQISDATTSGARLVLPTREPCAAALHVCWRRDDAKEKAVRLPGPREMGPLPNREAIGATAA